MAVSEIETRFLWLNLCFRGRLGQRNTDRQENMHACYRIQHRDIETGSTYNSGCKQDRDAIPAATPRFSRTPRRVEHRPTPKYARVVPNLAWRRRNRKQLQLRLQARQRRDSGGYTQVSEDAQQSGTQADNETCTRDRDFNMATQDVPTRKSEGTARMRL